MNKIKLAIFDMAGTTVDEDNVVYKTLQKVINEQGLNVSLEQVLKYGAGKEKYQAIIDILESVAGVKDVMNVADDAYKEFQAELNVAYDALDVSSFDGVEQLMADLMSKDIKVVINTGYNRVTAESLLGKLDWEVGETINAIITADDVVNGRPSPDMIYKAMEMFEITDPSTVLKAGDSLIDIEEGKNARCGMTVGVLSGAQTRAQLEVGEPTFILRDISQLREILL